MASDGTSFPGTALWVAVGSWEAKTVEMRVGMSSAIARAEEGVGG